MAEGKAEAQVHRIGVLAKRGGEMALRKWEATAVYLTRSIPGHRFRMVPLDFDAIFGAAERGRIDFILANSAIYVEMEARFGASRLATLRNRAGPGEVTRFGSVILTRADADGIQGLRDLPGKTFMGVDPRSLGGYLMARRLLMDRGVEPDDFQRLEFGATHDAVVRAVAAGRVDAGAVRTDTLERMAAEGRIDLSTFRILDPRRFPDFPFRVSTRLYPEWPFARLPGASPSLARRVAVALLEMPPDSPAARAGRNRGWTVPRNYHSVHELMRALRLGPYADPGPIGPRDILRQYGPWLAGSAAVFLALVLAISYFLHLNRRLRESRRALRQAHDRLEERVTERTAQLAASERKYRGIIDGTREGFLALDRESGAIGEANPAFCALVGYERAELLGGHPDRLLAESADFSFDRALEGSPESGRAFETTLWSRDGERIPVLVHFNRADGEALPHYAFLTDLRRIKEAQHSLQRANRALEVLSGSNRAMLYAAGEAELLERVCRVAAEEGGYPAAWIVREDPQGAGMTPVARAGNRSDEGAELEAACVVAEGQCPARQALETGGPVVFRDLQKRADPPWAARAARMGMAAVAALPLDNDTIRGGLVIFATEPEAFDQGEARLLQELAEDLAFGIRDLRVRAEREEHLHRLRQSAAVFDNSAEGVIITAPDERIVAVNPAFTAITGYTEEEVLGETPRILSSGIQGPDFYRGLWRELKETDVWQGEIWNRRKSGEVFPEYLTISAVRDEQGVLTNYVSVFADITEVKRSQEELDFLANHDPLTELPNRRLFNDRLDHALDHARRNDSALAVLFLDLDGFKNVNDSLGHPVGDRLLVQVAQRLAQRIRQTDTLARIGGDEFLILLESVAGPEDVEVVARDILEEFRDSFRLAGQEISLSASMGISLYPADGEDTATLMKNADAALFRAKEQGRGQLQYYTRELTDNAAARLQMERELEAAVERGQLELHFQPKIDLASGAVRGAEALVRWRHPQWGLVSPGKFIPLAEETGLILPVGEWVLRAACRQIREWAQAGLAPGRVGVNVSAVQLHRQNLPSLVAGVAGEEGCGMDCLELELTEASIMQNTAVTARALAELRQAGVELAIDDFGTGYSSLGYLKNLPLDTLKIDKSFVDDVPAEESDVALIRTIIGMGTSLGLKVVAEGVETEEQAGFLQAEGCGAAQGFLYSPALPAREFTEMLRRRGA